MKGLFLLGPAMILLAGCFDEPTPAYESVLPETQVYLKDGRIDTFTEDVLMKDGKVFVQGSGWTNLSARVSKLDAQPINYLNLDRNGLTNVDALAAFTGLKWLRLSGNRLASLPDLSEAKGLKRVYLRGNLFREVPDTLKALDKLTDLDISDNPVESVPEWLACKKGLENLSFSRTKIKSLPSDLSAWKTLRTLQLGDLRELSEDEMRRVREALPGTAVVF